MTDTQQPGAADRIHTLLDIGDLKAGRNELSERDITDLHSVLAQHADMARQLAALRTEWAFQYTSYGVTETSLVCESREEAEHEAGRHHRGDRIVHRLCGDWEVVEGADQ